MRKIIILFVFVLSGCESSQDMFKTQSDEGSTVDAGVRCEMMARTGTNRKTKVCRTIEQIEKDKESAERSLQRMQKTGGTVGS
ncbi:hypothetical protein [Shewanella kaireitica]|uniref:hypothetical protein n=1 Tax=Shewanella kaireitica TaxID=212021 RepID=UPI00200BB8CC|nr:hypothetical protein [Shewanella kaireitica]MCL1093183.1 hypothetical protein [Shewanella kaireitica]